MNTTDTWLERVLDDFWRLEVEPSDIESEVNMILEEVTATAHIVASLHIASDEGRLNPVLAKLMHLPTGTFDCPTCGMLHWTADMAYDCCVEADRETTAPRERMHPGSVAVVVDRVQFKRGLVKLVALKGYTSIYAISRDYGFTPKSLSNMSIGHTKWLKDERWGLLLDMFDGVVPGCIEVSKAETFGGEYEDDGCDIG